MANELELHPEYNQYPDVITVSENNFALRSPYSTTDLYFCQTRDTIADSGDFRKFIKNCESTFRASREYKAYKAYLIETLGIDRCQILGNVTMEDADIELHHNVMSLFDICVLICLHVINTVGKISTFDLVQLLVIEHYNNRVGVTFLSKTAHQIYTNDPNGFIPASMTFGKWWELLYNYKYGITYDLAYKIIKYIKNNQDQMPVSINLEQQEEILNFAWFNEYGTPPSECGTIPYAKEFDNGGYSDYGF